MPGRAITSLFAFVVAIVGMFGSAAAQAVRIGVDPWIPWAPTWVAQEKGMWRRHGLDVEVVGFTGSDTSAAFRAGKIDFAMVMAGTAVGLKLDGVDVVVLGEIDWSHGGDKMVARKGKKLADLKGQRIGIYEDSPAVWMFLAAKLKADGLHAKDFEVVVVEEMEALASQFSAGRLACAVSYEPYVEQAMATGGCEVIATTADFPGVMPEVLVAQRTTLAKLKPEQVVALWRGWIDAVEWSKDEKNAAEFARICCAKAFFDEKVEPKEIPAMLANVRIHGRDELRARNLGGATTGIAKFLDECLTFAVAHAGKGGKPSVASMLDTSALQQALGGAVPTAPAK